MQKRKLIEVALPLEAINKASAREKSIRRISFDAALVVSAVAGSWTFARIAATLAPGGIASTH